MSTSLRDFAVRNLPLESINSLSSSFWRNTSLKQQLSQSEDDYVFVIADFKKKLVVVVVQHCLRLCLSTGVIGTHSPVIYRSVKVRLHAAICRADFVSWCMLYTYEGNKMHL